MVRSGQSVKRSGFAFASRRRTGPRSESPTIYTLHSSALCSTCPLSHSDLRIRTVYTLAVETIPQCCLCLTAPQNGTAFAAESLRREGTPYEPPDGRFSLRLAHSVEKAGIYAHGGAGIG